MADSTPPIRVLIDNRRAKHEYELIDVYEAGVSLLGSEVKSLRAGQANLQEAFVTLKDAGAFLHGLHISPYSHATLEQHAATRPRQLLLHRHELAKMQKATRQKGMTLVPTKIYLKGSRIKVEVAIARGKKLHDKRQSLKERDAKRDMARHRDR
jgi:SsrA-binding protein